MPLARLKVSGLVRCGEDYLFIRRTLHGRSKSFLVCPGGRVEQKDIKIHQGRKDLELSLKAALERELFEELGAVGINTGAFLSVSRLHQHSREVLFEAKVEEFDWEKRTGAEFANPNLGTFELVKIRHFEGATLGRSGYKFEPKEWRNLIHEYAITQLVQ